jgi:DNA adenine methylase
LSDYQEMATILGAVKAKFILSLNDHPEMCEIFDGFKIQKVKLKYTVAEKAITEGNELLIRNF